MKKRWMPHFFAIAGLLVFSVLGLGSAATRPAVAAAALPAAPAEAEAQAPGAVIDRTVPDVMPVMPRRVAPVENIGDAARVSQAPWSAHTIIPSKNYTVVGAVVVRNTDSTSVLADLMERAIAMGGHDIKNVTVTHTITDDGAQVSSAIAVVIRYTNETLTVRESLPDSNPAHRIVDRYIRAPRDVGIR
ncbi:MAG: hypothetical protein FWB99_08360 [Treponema sp.]|nr:hypothetical protein [Treponema sp.]